MCVGRGGTPSLRMCDTPSCGEGLYGDTRSVLCCVCHASYAAWDLKILILKIKEKSTETRKSKEIFLPRSRAKRFSAFFAGRVDDRKGVHAILPYKLVVQRKGRRETRSPRRRRTRTYNDSKERTVFCTESSTVQHTDVHGQSCGCVRRN